MCISCKELLICPVLNIFFWAALIMLITESESLRRSVFLGACSVGFFSAISITKVPMSWLHCFCPSIVCACCAFHVYAHIACEYHLAKFDLYLIIMI